MRIERRLCRTTAWPPGAAVPVASRVSSTDRHKGRSCFRDYEWLDTTYAPLKLNCRDQRACVASFCGVLEAAAIEYYRLGPGAPAYLLGPNSRPWRESQTAVLQLITGSLRCCVRVGTGQPLNARPPDLQTSFTSAMRNNTITFIIQLVFQHCA